MTANNGSGTLWKGYLWTLLFLFFIVRLAAAGNSTGNSTGRQFDDPFFKDINDKDAENDKRFEEVSAKNKAEFESTFNDITKIIIGCSVGVVVLVLCCCAACGFAAYRRNQGVRGAPIMAGGAGMGYGMGVQPGYQQTAAITTTGAPNNYGQSSTPSQQAV